MKISFEEIEFNCLKITEFSASAEDFVEIWQAYLLSSGWSEESYEAELMRQPHLN